MVLLVCAAMVLVASSTAAEAGKTLTYKFKEGDKFTYTMDQDIDMKMNVVGQEVNIKMNQKIEMKQVIGAVSSDGVADITMKISRILMDMQGPPGASRGKRLGP